MFDPILRKLLYVTGTISITSGSMTILSILFPGIFGFLLPFQPQSLTGGAEIIWIDSLLVFLGITVFSLGAFIILFYKKRK